MRGNGATVLNVRFKMKTVFDNRQCAHVWAQQNQERGRSSNGNLFFEGKTIYRYGYHFPIAYYFDDDTVIFCNEGYSVSTSKHKGYVRNAVSHRALRFCSNRIMRIIVADRGLSSTAINAVYEEAKKHFEDAVKSAVKRRTKTRKAKDIAEGIDLVRNAVQFLDALGGICPALTLFWERISSENSEYVATALTAEKDKEQREQKYREDEYAKYRAAWLDFSATYNDDGKPAYDLRAYGWGPTLLRVNGDEIETSRGAKFPVSHAKQVFLFVRKCRETMTSWEGAAHGQNQSRLGHFKVDSIDPRGNVHAGCHYVEWSAIEHAARELNIYP